VELGALDRDMELVAGQIQFDFWAISVVLKTTNVYELCNDAAAVVWAMMMPCRHDVIVFCLLKNNVLCTL
jgi:hypothetical protein